MLSPRRHDVRRGARRSPGWAVRSRVLLQGPVGYAEEFLRLFRKNHLPLLRRRMQAEEIVGLAINAPC